MPCLSSRVNNSSSTCKCSWWSVLIMISSIQQCTRPFPVISNPWLIERVQRQRGCQGLGIDRHTVLCECSELGTVRCWLFVFTSNWAVFLYHDCSINLKSGYNVSVKSKLKHPPGHAPGIWRLLLPEREGIWWTKSSPGRDIWSLLLADGEFDR